MVVEGSAELKFADFFFFSTRRFFYIPSWRLIDLISFLCQTLLKKKKKKKKKRKKNKNDTRSD